MQKEKLYDVAVIGGGPAGMMAAIHAAMHGANVVLIEKNEKLGKKLLITGGGRCNVTNATFDNRALSQKYGAKGKFLLSPLSRWNPENTIRFFEERNVPTKTEPESRVFPVSNSAQSIWDALTAEIKKQNIKIILNTAITKINKKNDEIVNIETSKEIVSAKKYIIATGGKARPETGSTGEGFLWLSKLGHTIITPDLALVPVKIGEPWIKNLQGLSLPETAITLIEHGKKNLTQKGKLLFTHFGISGPLALNLSNTIREAMKESTVTLSLDFFPSINNKELDERLRDHLKDVQNKKWRNALKGFLPPLLAQHILEISKIDPELFVNKIPKESRLFVVNLLKNLIITPTGFLGQEKAIVSSGGVALEEIDFKTMRSHKIKNLFLTGDVLNFDRPSGGFSLQICWTTGYIAGISAAEATKSQK